MKIGALARPVGAFMQLRRNTPTIFGSGLRVEPELQLSPAIEHKEKPIGIVNIRDSHDDITLRETWTEVRHALYDNSLS